MKNLFERVLADRPECMMKTVYGDSLFLMQNYKMFISQETYCNNASILVDDINCSDHPDYINKPWLYILENAPRMKANLAALERNPDYYLGEERKDWCFKEIIIDGKDINGKDFRPNRLFPYHSGNHRTAIAKAFLHYEQIPAIHGVTLFQEVLDYELSDAFEWFNICNQKGRLMWGEVEVIRKEVNVIEDEEDKRTFSYKLALKFSNYKNDKELIIDAHEVRELIQEAEKLSGMSLFHIFRSNKYAKFLR